MASSTVRDQLVARSVSARYNLFVGLGSALALVGAALFILYARGDQADRAWHLFHVNWVYFTGLTGGSFAFVAVQKVTKAKWSGVIIRFAEAAPFFFWPVSVVGFLERGPLPAVGLYLLVQVPFERLLGHSTAGGRQAKEP
ncbi:MAG TPA: hypothetical protein PKA50_05100, partial [Gemmatimonadales bacterium]|nr:hypothetical protein [Gemmatimonadales bacterium]